MDEFPYWVSSSPGLPAVVQRWVDAEAREDGLLTIIAGSSQEMMQGLVLPSNAPLYGRALEAIDLQPLAPRWIGPALGLSDPLDAIKAYAVWGGIPRYWELAGPYSAAFEDAVDALVLDPQGPLHREPDRLLTEELPPAVALRPVLDAIGGGAHRVSEIAARLGQPATSLSRPLSRLIDLGLVDRQVPHGDSEKSGKRTLYRIRDPFFRFWFRVVAPHRALLASASERARRAHLHSLLPALLGAAWEQLCLLAASAGDRLGRAPFDADMPLIARRWWHGAAPEWDIVATPPSGAYHILGEVKWSDSPFRAGELEQLAAALLKRPAPPHLKGERRHVLFVPQAEIPITRSGVPVIDGRAVLETCDG